MAKKANPFAAFVAKDAKDDAKEMKSAKGRAQLKSGKPDKMPSMKGKK